MVSTWRDYGFKAYNFFALCFFVWTLLETFCYKFSVYLITRRRTKCSKEPSLLFSTNNKLQNYTSMFNISKRSDYTLLKWYWWLRFKVLCASMCLISDLRRGSLLENETTGRSIRLVRLSQLVKVKNEEY